MSEKFRPDTTITPPEKPLEHSERRLELEPSIDQQKIILKKVMEDYGFSALRQDYKTSIFRVEKNVTKDLLTMVCQTVQAKMEIFLRKQLKQLKEKLANGQSGEVASAN